MQAPPEGDPCGSRSHTKEALTKPSCPPSPCGLSMPSAEARGPGGSSAAAAPARLHRAARTASCRGAIPPRPSAQLHMARLLRCANQRRQETAGPAPPHPPTRTGRQPPLGDMGRRRRPNFWVFRTGGSLGLPKSHAPKQHRPAVWVATQLHTARLLGALDKDAARRPPAQPTSPSGPGMPQQPR